MVHLQGDRIAPRALEWLSSADEPRIHSLYRQSINLITSEQRLLSVVLPQVGPGPFAIVVELPDAAFRGFNVLNLESPVAVEGGQIEIGLIQLETAGAKEWQPRPAWKSFGEALDSSALASLSVLLHKHAPPDSFAPLANGTLPEIEKTIQSKASRAAARPAELLLTSLAAGNIEGAGEAATGLAGLGAGVTPSGDDFLQGAIYALWAKQGEKRARPMAEAIVSKATPRTNVISGEWLRSAARGEAGADWHLLTQAVAMNRPVDKTMVQLLNRGHTSGADAMAGFLAMLSMLI